MFEKFKTDFPVCEDSTDATRDSASFPLPLATFLMEFGGKSVCNGLYRIFGDTLRADIKESLSLGFPGWNNHVYVLGADWLGRVLAVRVDKPHSVLLFDAGVGDVQDSQMQLADLHNDALSLEVFADKFYEEWLAAGGTTLKYSECAGYKIPLFLGGADAVSNLEISDLSVYWHITCQLLAGVRSRQQT